jgi:hypothetical protein
MVLSTAVKVTAQEPPPAMEAAMEELGPPPPEMAKAEDGGEFRDPGDETVLERDRYFAKRRTDNGGAPPAARHRLYSTHI